MSEYDYTRQQYEQAIKKSERATALASAEVYYKFLRERISSYIVGTSDESKPGVLKLTDAVAELRPSQLVHVRVVLKDNHEPELRTAYYPNVGYGGDDSGVIKFGVVRVGALITVFHDPSLSAIRCCGFYGTGNTDGGSRFIDLRDVRKADILIKEVEPELTTTRKDNNE